MQSTNRENKLEGRGRCQKVGQGFLRSRCVLRLYEVVSHAFLDVRIIRFIPVHARQSISILRTTKEKEHLPKRKHAGVPFTKTNEKGAHFLVNKRSLDAFSRQKPIDEAVRVY